MSGFSLHIKCGGGRRARSGEIEAAPRSSAPAPGPTAAPETRDPAVLSASLLATPERTWCLPEIEKGERSGSWARSPGALASREYGHGQDQSEAPSH